MAFEFVMPRKFVLEEEREEKDHYYARFSIQPLEKGYAITLGNALRRVLLSSIPSLAITKLRIPGKYHEFDTINGVKEDIIEIMLNLKKVQLYSSSPVDGFVRMTIEKKGPGEVKAGDIKTPTGIEIMNPDQHIATLNEDAIVYIELFARTGMGFVPVSEMEPDDNIETILIDGVFSPVLRVNFLTENVRVGKRTDYDKLILEIWTKRNIRPMDALKQSVNILVDHFRFIDEELEKLGSGGTLQQIVYHVEESSESLEEEEVEESEYEDIYNRKIEELDLPARITNALKREKILTIGDLVNKAPAELLKIKNFGKKSLEEVEERLEIKFGISLTSKSKEGEQ
ncbi:MAG: DNA-directed polymerase subunit alpha [Thermotogota bacterium]|nr:DNA-directed polymerase subunit alpha [Thermotogota bacterium]MDK2864151.1 DNA-directed polymerase subunit alpha [Thermotogota bacterium]